MKKIIVSTALALLAVTGTRAQNAWINELHYDNAGTDADELVEVVIENAGAYALADFKVTLYNGNNGAMYDERTLDTYTAGETSGAYQFFYLNYTAAGSSIQNGAPDGICLSYQGTMLQGQFLSYEGAMTATDGPAQGQTSADIGVSEVNSPAGQSLQLAGTGANYASFSWQAPAAATAGIINNGQFFGAYTPDPEPSEYPLAFAVQATGISMHLTWTDAGGAQLPAGYLVLATASSSVTPPADGTPVSSDADLSDGQAAVYVPFGVQMVNFDFLPANTPYNFKIFPYTNSAQYIDYKTDGQTPAGSAITQPLIHSQNFDTDMAPWTQYSVTGTQLWVIDSTHGVNGSRCAKMSGYEGGTNYPNVDWLISPSFDFSHATDHKLVFASAMNYGTGDNTLAVLVSSDFTGGDPSSSGTWTDVTSSVVLSPGTWTWTPSGYVDMSQNTGTNVHVAFKYTSETDARTWEIDNVYVTGISSLGFDNTAAGKLHGNVSPNPCREWFTAEIPAAVSMRVRMMNAQGRVVADEAGAGSRMQIPVTGLPGGMYLVILENRESGYRETHKIMVR